MEKIKILIEMLVEHYCIDTNWTTNGLLKFGEMCFTVGRASQ